jgi:hypothetical protein
VDIAAARVLRSAAPVPARQAAPYIVLAQARTMWWLILSFNLAGLMRVRET